MSKRSLLSLFTVGCIGFISMATRPSNNDDDNRLFEITRNMEIFTNIYKEINTHYVDEIDANKFMMDGMNAMLTSLDPYTVFIPQENADEYRYQITGRYGGIGASVRKLGTHFVVMEPYEGSPARRSGLLPGDEILAINGKRLTPEDPESTSDILKGEPGTEITLTIRHAGETREKDVKLVREEINVPNVPFYTVLDNGTAYISVHAFTERVSMNVEAALRDLSTRQEIKNIIIDMRGNGGGLLTEAVNLTGLFVPKNQEIVSTRGRNKDWDKVYLNLNEPIESTKPLVVLVDDHTASASEIFAGAIQDVDRGILIGQRTYGKGLVQNTRDVGYNARVKMTTAKYYTPSGRCIQSVHYKSGRADQIADSLRIAFRTKGGRTVLDGGGIEPDIKIDQVGGYILSALNRNFLIHEYATQYKLENPSIASAAQFHLTDKEFEEFISYVRAKGVDFQTESEKILKTLEDKSRTETYYNNIGEEITALRQQIEKFKYSDLNKYKKQIAYMLEREIVSRFYLSKGRIEYGINHDPEIMKALDILSKPGEYNRLLSK